MKKFAIAAATATALTLTMANAAFAQQSTQAPMTLAAGEVTKTKEAASDTWITTKVKADLMTEKGVPGSDIKVETNKGVVSLSSDVAVTDSQKEMAVAIAKKIKGVQAVSADGQQWHDIESLPDLLSAVTRAQAPVSYTHLTLPTKRIV